MKEIIDSINKYLAQIRPNKSFKIVFDPEFENENDFWREYKGFSVPEPCGPEGTFERVGALINNDEIHFGLNPVSPVGFHLRQCIEAINSLQLPY